MAPAKFTASPACRDAGLTAVLPLPWASLRRLRSVPSPSTTHWQPPRICLKTTAVCWLGARFSFIATSLYSLGRSNASSYSTPASSRMCLQVVSMRLRAAVMAPSGSSALRSRAFCHAATMCGESTFASVVLQN